VAGETAVISLIGQTGTGKTTTLAKLASRMVRAGRRVVLATLDSGRIGVEAQLRAFGSELRVPTISLDDPARLAAELGRVPGRVDVLLIDGSGDEGRDITALQTFEDHCRASGARTRFSTLLVLAATASEDAIRAAINAAEPIEPVGAVITKIDETERPLPALEQAREAGLGLAFLTNGPDLAPHFHRARPERVADVALLGRIA
jgi:flagellar biosynthesis protein FlhF